MSKVIDSLSLECRSGSKDAVYQLQLVEVDGGFVVNYQNGRRGGTLAAGTKTKAPVSLEAARKIYDKVAKEKMTAQPPYLPVQGSGAAFQAVTLAMEEQSTGLVPQLLNDVPEGSEEQLIRSEDFIMQMKVDGERRMLRATASAVIGSNRRGLQVPLPTVIEEAVRGLVCELDGEIIDSRLYVFDLLSLDDKDLRGLGCLQRKEMLDSMEHLFGHAIKVLAHVRSEAAKRELIARTRALGQEGVVFKHVAAPYTPGRRASGLEQLKLKNWKDATVIVLGAKEDRRSVRIGVLDDQDELIEVGSTTVPPNRNIPEQGALLDVRYLYAFPGGDLFQPVFKQIRTDLVREDARASRLQYKAEHVDIEIADLEDPQPDRCGDNRMERCAA